MCQYNYCIWNLQVCTYVSDLHVYAVHVGAWTAISIPMLATQYLRPTHTLTYSHHTVTHTQTHPHSHTIRTIHVPKHSTIILFHYTHQLLTPGGTLGGGNQWPTAGPVAIQWEREKLVIATNGTNIHKAIITQKSKLVLTLSPECQHYIMQTFYKSVHNWVPFTMYLIMLVH